MLRKIALVSFLVLFLELLIIRLVGTEIRIFAYLGNLLLLAIFVGSGIGMHIRRKIPVETSAVLLFFLTSLVNIVYILRTPRFDVKLFSGISELVAPLSEAYIWQTLSTFSKSGAIFGLLLTAGILILTAAIFLPLGHLLGELLDKSPRPLLAYSVNVGASLMGMWSFQLWSIAGLPPLLGLAAAALTLIFLIPDRLGRWAVLFCVMAIVALSAPKSANQPYEGPTTFWSPYQKLTLSLIRPNPEFPHRPKGYYLEVNNVGYMGLLKLDEKHALAANEYLIESQKARSEDLPYLDQYTLPFYFVPPYSSVLLIGAGAGNDADGALRAGANKITAVEIDPTILKLGNIYHPQKPYNDPRVRVAVADGRAFMERERNTYDLIIMGLADSHTLSSTLTNLRLDHYLYTRESLSRAKKLLNENGVLVLSFEVTRPWIGERLEKTLAAAFGSKPLIFEVRSDGAFGWGGYFFVVSKNPDALERILTKNPDLRDFISSREKSFSSSTINASTINSLTDDWPYLYLDRSRLPLIHILMAIFVIGALLVARKTLLSSAKMDWPMFFWGAAFLLFEFQNVTKASLLFGLTWQTNLVVISAALIMILLANLSAQLKFISERTAFWGLAASLALQLLIPLYQLNRWSLVPKLLMGGALLNIPFFFGGIIFAYWFARSRDRSSAFASNLLGAAIGGLIEMVSFLSGIKFLLVIAFFLYVAGWRVHKSANIHS